MAATLLWLSMQACAHHAHASEGETRNWFGDPFFAISEGMQGCPLPRGPYLSEAEMKAESHGRAERGTSCWLAGRCSHHSAYQYDPEIAGAIQRKMASHPLFAGDSLWITVSRRFVWVEGCVTDGGKRDKLESLLRDIPDVDRVMVDVMQGTSGKPPYRLRNEPPRSR
jgi:hypothetical protein